MSKRRRRKRKKIKPLMSILDIKYSPRSNKLPVKQTSKQTSSQTKTQIKNKQTITQTIQTNKQIKQANNKNETTTFAQCHFATQHKSDARRISV